jgi:hypothetical protein
VTASARMPFSDGISNDCLSAALWGLLERGRNRRRTPAGRRLQHLHDHATVGWVLLFRVPWVASSRSRAPLGLPDARDTAKQLAPELGRSGLVTTTAAPMAPAREAGAPSRIFAVALCAAALPIAALAAYLIESGRAKYALVVAVLAVLLLTLLKKEPQDVWPGDAKVATWKVKVALVAGAVALGAFACYYVRGHHIAEACLIALLPLPVAMWTRPDHGRPEDAKDATVRVKIMLVAGAVLFGGLAADLASSGHLSRGVAVGLLLLPVAIWKRPYLGPTLLVGVAVVVEQTPVFGVNYTGTIPIFQGVGPGHLEGGDILILMIAGVYFAKRRSLGRWRPRSHVSAAMVGLLAAMLIGIIVGQAHGGALRVEFQQCRPFVYLAATYFLTSVLVTDRKGILAVLWAFVLAVAFKSAQGLLNYWHLRHDTPRPETFIGHEMSQFFVAYIILVMALWLFREEGGRLRYVATRLLPLVIACDLVNDRRAAWEMLGFAVLTLGVIAYRAAPMRRGLLGKCVVVLTMISALYFPVFWNSQTSSLAAPAHAIASQVNPSTRDADSDDYRIEENANLELNIRQGGLLGKGFGVPIDYALPIVDLSTSSTSELEYVTHNNVLYVLVTMGLLGGVAMRSLIATGIIAGCRLTRCSDRLPKVIGTLVACSLVSYAIIGALDVGFYWSRIAYVTGAMLGLAEAARRINMRRQVSPDAAASLAQP